MNPVSCLVPTGHLSYAPMEPGSFYAGLEEHPGAIIADAGSCDIGPYPLGSGGAASPEEWQRFDLDHMLRGARKLQVPMIVSSCNDTGTNAGVDKFVGLIKAIAAQHRLAPFKLAAIRYTLNKTLVADALHRGVPIKGLDGRPDLTAEVLAQAETIVTLAARGIFYARLPTKGAATGGAFLTEDVLVGKPAYEWTLNHIMQIENPLDLFPITLETIGAP